jgi:protein involved in polysaccharide export with SLBB domain
MPLLALLVAAVALSGCATSRTASSDAYVDQLLADTLGPVETPAEPARKAATPLKPETPETPSVAKPATASATERSAVPVEAAVPEQAVTDAAVIAAGGPVLCPGIVTIQSDAILWITVAEDPSLDGRYVVGRDADIDFNYAGLVRLKDMNVEQAEAKLRATLEGRYLNKATVTVRIAKASYDRVGVAGAVYRPMEMRIEPGCSISLREALLGVGGVKLAPGLCKAKVIRNGLLSPFGVDSPGEVYDLGSVQGVLRVPQLRLQNNDLVHVFHQEPLAEVEAPGKPVVGPGPRTVILLGEVPRRGTISFSENEPCTMMYLLFKIGGLPRFAKAHRVQVVRRGPDGEELKLVVNAEALMRRGDPDDDVPLQSGDRIIVPTRKFVFF